MKTDTEYEKLIRQEIRSLEPYRSPAFDCRIKLDLNESPFDIPAELKDRIYEKARGLNWHRYHDEFEPVLKKQLAEHDSHLTEGVLIGNGSNALIFHALLASVGAGDAVVFPEPTFSLYRQNVTVLGGNPAAFRLREKDFSLDEEQAVALVEKSGAAAVVLCSPNNPTGNRISNAAIERIAGSAEALVIVDEAYTHFAEDSAFELLAKYPNLILLRTFSKAFGLAGLRFGYALCAPELAHEIVKVQLPHHVSFFTQLAALTMLEEPLLVEERVAEIKRGRRYLQERLAHLPGIRPLASETNFILIECGEKPAAEVFNGLLKLGVLIRNVSGYPGLSRYLRITVGKPAENEALIAALEEVL